MQTFELWPTSRVIIGSRDASYQLSQDVLISFAPADCLLLAG